MADLDPQEISKIKGKLDKFLDQKGSDPAEVMNMLKSLGQAKVTVKVLQQTKIGISVTKLKKNEDSKISEVARLLVQKWKDVAEKERKGVSPGPETPKSIEKKGSFSAVTPPGKAVSRQNSVTSMGSTKGEPAVKPENLESTGEKVRDSIRDKLGDALATDGVVPGDKCPWKLAAEIEEEMYTKLGGVSGEYKAKFRTLKFNLSDPKNPDLRANMKSGSVSASRLIDMEPAEMASDEMKKEREATKKYMKDMTLSAMQYAEQSGHTATTDQFKCGKCGERKCTYFQMQTRSADEPMTTFVTCKVCDNRWKFC